MKTKLLKKVRERYSITRYTEINDPDHFLYREKMPIIVLQDTKAFDCYAWYEDKGLETYEKAYNKLVSWIKYDYRKTSKKRFKIKSKKLWYDGSKE